MATDILGKDHGQSPNNALLFGQVQYHIILSEGLTKNEATEVFAEILN